MNGTLEDARKLATEIVAGLDNEQSLLGACSFVVCPPFIHLDAVKQKLDGKHIWLGAQDCAAQDNGAYTGEISADMLADFGCKYVILGHSERRQFFGETDRSVFEKAQKALSKGLKVIICVGETESERDAGKEKDIVGAQLAEAVPQSGVNADNLVIAYEPVWAIGTGKTATPDDVKEMHAFIRETLEEKLADSENIRILYGGSVKPGNAEELFKVPNVDGALIGGASLKADDYLAIARAA